MAFAKGLPRTRGCRRAHQEEPPRRPRSSRSPRDDSQRWSRGADLYNPVTWKSALVVAGVLPPPVKDSRGRSIYKEDRTVGLHALRHYYARITLADGVNSRGSLRGRRSRLGGLVNKTI